MRSIVCRSFACLTLLLSCLPSPGADLTLPAKAPAPAGDTSLEQFIANAKRSAETGPTELKALVAQLDPLKDKRKALLATRRAKESELARLQSAGGDAQRTAALRKEVDASSSQLNIVDTQFQVLIYRIQALQNPEKNPASLMMPGAKAPANPANLAGPTPARLTRTVPPDKIKAAATELARNPTPSAAAARTAATQLLASSQPGYASTDIDQLAQLVLRLAAQDTEAELRAELAALQKANGQKSDKIEFKVTLPSDRNRVQELQVRQAKLEQAINELSPKSSPLPPKSPEKKSGK
jgi:hypothetical protein